MMDPASFKKMELWGMLIVLIAAFAFHFLYTFSGESRAVALFAPVNESVWEHVKLLFFPFALYAVVEYFLLRPSLPAFLYAKSVALLLGPLLMIAFFYTYTGILGTHSLVIDLVSTVVWVVLSFIVSYRLYMSPGSLSVYWPIFTVAAALFMLMLFIFTFAPPKLPLFYDASGGHYGL